MIYNITGCNHEALNEYVLKYIGDVSLLLKTVYLDLRIYCYCNTGQVGQTMHV